MDGKALRRKASAIMLLFPEIVSQVYEDKVECEGVAASLLIKWNLYEQNSGSKTTELPKAADICTSEHIPTRQKHAHSVAPSISTCLTGSVCFWFIGAR